MAARQEVRERDADASLVFFSSRRPFFASMPFLIPSHVSLLALPLSFSFFHRPEVPPQWPRALEPEQEPEKGRTGESWRRWT